MHKSQVRQGTKIVLSKIEINDKLFSTISMFKTQIGCNPDQLEITCHLAH